MFGVIAFVKAVRSTVALLLGLKKALLNVAAIDGDQINVFH